MRAARQGRVNIHDPADQTATKMYIDETHFMSETQTHQLNIVCFATFFKGGDFMRECKAAGCNVTLVTKEKMLQEEWPRDALEGVFALPNDAPVELFFGRGSHLAETEMPDRIVALEDVAVVSAGGAG